MQQIQDTRDRSVEGAQAARVSVSRPGGQAQRFDVLVVGDGSTAQEAALVAAQAGRSVALIRPTRDAWDPEGNPTLIYEALDRLACDEPVGDGWPGQPINVSDLLNARRHPPSGALESLTGAGVTLLQGAARFLSPRSISIDDRHVAFQAAVLAPGLERAISDLPAHQASAYLTESRLVELARVPYRLAVVGTGYHACRWADLFRRLGSEVHLVALAERMLPEEDPELESIVQEQFARRAIRLHLGCRAIALESMGRGKALTLSGGAGKEKLLVDEVLACAPPRLATGELDLAAAGIQGMPPAMVADRWLRTSNPHVFAICSHPNADPHAALAAARVAATNASARVAWRGAYHTFDWRLTPRCLRLEQEMLIAGTADDEVARRAGPLSTYHETVASGATRDVLRVTVETLSGRPVAVMAVAVKAEMWVGPLLMLMQERRSIAGLARLPLAGSAHAECLQRMGRRWAAEVRQRFGAGLCGAAAMWRARTRMWLRGGNRPARGKCDP